MASLSLLMWNVYEKNAPSRVVAALRSMTSTHRPAVVVLQEAKNLVGRLDGIPGYRVYQSKSVARRRGNAPESANIAILVRSDVKVKRVALLRLRLEWLGPKLGKPHDPRVFRWLLLVSGGVTWKVAGGHGPFGKRQRDEYEAALRNLIRRTVKGRPVLVAVDGNESVAEARRDIARPVGAAVAGNTVDHFIFKNCSVVRIRVLDKAGSDHAPRLIDAEAPTRGKR